MLNDIYGFEPFLIILLIAFYVIYFMAIFTILAGSIAGLSHMFLKMGEEPWKAIIPYYSSYCLFKHVWKKRFFFIMLFIEAVYIVCLVSLFLALGNYGGVGSFAVIAILIFITATGAIVINVMLCIRISKKFGMSGGYAVGLFFIRGIFYMILGFGRAQADPLKREKEEGVWVFTDYKPLENGYKNMQPEAIQSDSVKEENKE